MFLTNFKTSELLKILLSVTCKLFKTLLIFRNTVQSKVVFATSLRGMEFVKDLIKLMFFELGELNVKEKSLNEFVSREGLGIN